MRFVFTILLLTGALFSFSQSAFISGSVIDENDVPMAKVSVVILGKTTELTTNNSGSFKIRVPVDKSFALVFTCSGYIEIQKNFYLSASEEEKIRVQMERGIQTLQTMEISTEKERTETGLTKINSKNAITLPSIIGGVEGIIKILIGSNNELSSQYNVRGGNYDENLIYINNFEIFRPYLFYNKKN